MRNKLFTVDNNRNAWDPAEKESVEKAELFLEDAI